MKVVTVVGARPQFVKAAVLRKLFQQNGIQEILVHTGQHYDYKMSQVFFDELEMKPPEHFIELKGRSHGAMTGEILTDVEKVLQDEKPDICLVYGDTNSTIAGALAAAKIGIPVCHVEAGLRSFNKEMPEEVNRILTDHISDLLFCSTHVAVENLKNENISRGVHHVGDIMYDAVKLFADASNAQEIISSLSLDRSKPLAMMTVHRQATVDSDEMLGKVIAYCRAFTKDHSILFPAHPRTAARITTLGIDLGDIKIIEPLAYKEMQALLASSSLLITDSGGLQKEAYFHKVRCITLRSETEWVETIAAGWNRLWTQDEYECDPIDISEYGDGDSAEKMIRILIESYKP